MKVFAIINQKGGVGKTTSTVNIGAGLAELKKRVLLIDLDPQANLSQSLDVHDYDSRKNIYDLLSGHATFNEVMLAQGKNLTIIPSSIALTAFEHEAHKRSEREYILKNILKSIDNFDYVLIDCPPSLGLLTLNALAAAQEVLIPVQTEYLALQGLSQLLETYNVVKERINTDLEIGGVIGMRFNRRKIHKEVLEYLRKQMKDKLFNTVIRENIAIAEAPSFGKDIYSYSPKSVGAQDYKNLCKEIIKRSQL